ncbi:MAG: hypothetical protein K6356_14275 [Chloroflexus sp.]
MYAGTRLQTHADVAEVYARHANYYAGLAETAGRLLEGAAASSTLAQINDNLPNLCVAICWSLATDGGVLASRITAALRLYWLRRRRVSEG